MNYRLTILLALCLSVSALSAQTAENRVHPPQYRERGAGYADLSRGVYYRVTDTSLAEGVLAEVRKAGVSVTTSAAPRRSIVLELTQAGAISGIPADASNGYRLTVTPTRISVEYASVRAAITALQQLTGLRREHLDESSRRQRLPAYEIRGWTDGSGAETFRLRNTPFLSAERLNKEFYALIPAFAAEVEIVLTTAENGWLVPGEILREIDFEVPAESRRFYTYDELNRLGDTFGGYGLELIPTFDLATPNAHFESAIGHPMLSVEGMRFVRLLLEEFFARTEFQAAAFVVPAGRYREQVEEIVARYPQITDVRFYDGVNQ